MSTPYSQNEQVTDSRYFAVFCVYLGYDLVRLETSVREDQVKYTFAGIPECDWLIVQQEFSNPETTIVLQDFLKAIRGMTARFNIARKNGGTWQVRRG